MSTRESAGGSADLADGGGPPVPVRQREDVAACLIACGVEEQVALTAVSGAPTLRAALQRLLGETRGPLAVLEGACVATATPEPEPEVVALPAASSAGPVTSPWNVFQQRMAGAGLTRAEAARLYREEQQATARGVGGRSTTAVRPDMTTMSSGVAAPRAADGGYVVLKTPEAFRHLRGVHHCSWDELLAKFGATPQQWSALRAGYYTPRFRDEADATRLWSEQRLLPPMPVFWGPALTPA